MYQEFVDLLRQSSYCVVLTGAGVSTPSGIPDFRSPTGLYSKYPQEIFDIDYFYSSPASFYSFCKEVLLPMIDAQPNLVHEFLAWLEERGYVKVVITQNIDGLHQKAGSKDVVELHGNISRFKCDKCGKLYDHNWVRRELEKKAVPHCLCGGLIRPDIVFFKESLPWEAVNMAEMHSLSCDLMVVMGSSLVVYPAASFPILAKKNGAKLVIINNSETGLDFLCDLKIEKDLVEFCSQVWKMFQS
ncbi:NAD-dependent protein deacylase [Pseudothermotoga thermarum]|uniref:NAD-dependent protein deacetylase n=1 Tax=Pseudothermotoga thermarum DSM 5069 TaxID=688269 RepID=F7YWP7_9THEM|nr:Silent information regulator protein Sir2 [Pseudothermotoga thermarum DSM 5069]